MRLIDADELKKQLEHGVWNDIIKEIDDTPTAFDLEKVVEQLDKKEDFYSDQYNELKRRGIIIETAAAKSEAFAEARAIVKEGGME